MYSNRFGCLQWNSEFITKRSWTPSTYGPTQKLILSMLGDKFREVVEFHVLRSLVEFVSGWSCVYLC